jgi:hypothetical protein
MAPARAADFLELFFMVRTREEVRGLSDEKFTLHHELLGFLRALDGPMTRGDVQGWLQTLFTTVDWPATATQDDIELAVLAFARKAVIERY